MQVNNDEKQTIRISRFSKALFHKIGAELFSPSFVSSHILTLTIK